MRWILSVPGAFLVLSLIAGGAMAGAYSGRLAEEEAIKIETLDAPSGTLKKRFRITGEEDPARAIFENVNVGIGVSSPTEDLEVVGAVKIGNASGTADGTIRWTGSAFEARKSSAWNDLEDRFHPADKVWFLEDFERNSLRGNPYENEGSHNKTTVGGTYSQSGTQDFFIHDKQGGDSGPWDVSKNPIFTARAKITSNGSGSFYWRSFGIGNDDSSISIFRYGGSGKNWKGICKKNGSNTQLDTGVAADSTWRALSFKVTGGGTSVEFFIDGVSKGSITTNIPDDLLTLGINGQGSNAPNSECDFLYIEQDN